MTRIEIHDTRPGERSPGQHPAGSGFPNQHMTEENLMLRPYIWVSVTCDQCGNGPTDSGTVPHFSTEADAVDAVMAAAWVVAADGRLLCSACGPILICEVYGHQFTVWHQAMPGPGELARTCKCDPAGPLHLLGSTDCGRQLRYCRQCCLHESRTAAVVA